MTPKQIVIPNVKHPTHNTGMSYRNGAWQVGWRVNGKIKTKSSGTKDEIEARRFRDRLFASLVENGATVATRKKTYVKPVTIHKCKPFAVVHKGLVVAECDTIQQAEAAKKEYLKTLP